MSSDNPTATTEASAAQAAIDRLIGVPQGAEPPSSIWIEWPDKGDRRYFYAGHPDVAEQYILRSAHQKEVEELRRRDAQSRKSGCWCDEYGHPCKACEDKQQLTAEATRLREALRGFRDDIAGRVARYESERDKCESGGDAWQRIEAMRVIAANILFSFDAALASTREGEE